MMFRNTKLNDKIELRNKELKEKIKNPNNKLILIVELSKKIDNFFKEIQEKINKSESLISKIILESIDNDDLFNLNLKKFSDDITKIDDLFYNMRDMYTFKQLKDDNNTNKDRFNNNPEYTLAFIDFDRHIVKIAEDFAEVVGSNLTLGKEVKTRNMLAKTESIKNKFLEVILKEDVKEFKDSLTPDCLYNQIKDETLETQSRIIEKAINLKNIPVFDIRNAYIGTNIDAFFEKYKGDKMQLSFQTEYFPTFENKYSQYSDELDSLIKTTNKSENKNRQSI